MTALAFGYPAAAETLVRRGARVDNVVAAAGLGRLDLMKRFVNEDGSVKAGVPLVAVPGVPNLPKDPKAHMTQALIWACMLGRTEVVEFLLQKGVDPGATGNQGFTGLHWAAFYGHIETVALLLDWNAPLEVKNVYGGTVLDQTVWASVHSNLGINYVPIAEKLIEAGASVEVVRRPSGNERIDDMLRRHGAKL
jgi:ankyrin repeat protein